MDCEERIAIYGGTFDPVHLAHMEVARQISELFEIDELWFVPAQIAPHKLTRTVTPAIHRHAMLVLATQDDPKLFVSTFELEEPNRRYTVDTLAHFKSVLGDSSELFFIMGADSWSEITTWRDWERLLSMVNHIVVTRPGYHVDLDHVSSSVQARVVDLRGIGNIVPNAALETGVKIFITDAVTSDISATSIRRAVSAGTSGELEKLLPRSVASYIRKYGLYRESNEA